MVVAGGSGTRFGSPKQFLRLGGPTVVERSVLAARSVADGVVVVTPAGAPAPVEGQDLAAWGADLQVTGGATRAASVRAGLEAVPDTASVIVVHDAARPLARPSLFESVVAALLPGDADGVIPVVPVGDTLKRVAGDLVGSTVDRTGLVAVQTPQAFVASVLRSAHASGADASDDAALLEAAGATVRTVAGDPRNFKLTVPEDLEVARALLSVMPVTPVTAVTAERP